ncbi:MAG: esterase-like activity of phytase family protein [Bacteroidales bacterium]|nr:esterase-like activity of phytase family protein [Bacteroidales bacterium]
MKRTAIVLAALMCVLPVKAQGVGDLLGALLGAVVGGVAESADESSAEGQQALSKWGIKAANYSGITPLGDGRYAVVSDKESADGFYIWKIEQDPETGRIVSVANEGYMANKVSATSGRDCEGIVYVPVSGTVFISGEADQRIIEYDMEGQRTGRELDVPEQFSHVVGNQGLEALGFGGRGRRARFWATTETTLPADGTAAGPKAPGAENLLRVQSFKGNLKASKQYAYRMDAGRASDFGSPYVFGVPEVCALPDGSLLVLEREANIPKLYVGADVICKLYRVKPKFGNKISPYTSLSDLKDKKFLRKTLVDSWTTKLSVTNIAWANYEGMCLGAKLSDGRRTLILVSDSQGGYGKGPIHLQDFIKVIVLD